MFCFVIRSAGLNTSEYVSNRCIIRSAGLNTLKCVNNQCIIVIIQLYGCEESYLWQQHM
jgi:hypothetical protein